MKRSNNRQQGRGARRRAISLASGAAVALLATLPAMWPGPASAAASSTDGTGSGSSAAVVTPLLKFFEFGNSIGLPLACNDAASIVSIIGAQSGQNKLISPLVNELNGECSQLSSEGNGYLQQAITESQSLSLINPYVDPLIADLANALQVAGTTYGPSLAPFGPTVAGLGGTVAFFEGS